MMNGWAKWLWGGLGWAVAGPIGAILGFALGAAGENVEMQTISSSTTGGKTAPGDFGSALLILCGGLMKADNRLLKSELDFVKHFFVNQFGIDYAKERM